MTTVESLYGGFGGVDRGDFVLGDGAEFVGGKHLGADRIRLLWVGEHVLCERGVLGGDSTQEIYFREDEDRAWELYYRMRQRAWRDGARLACGSEFRCERGDLESGDASTAFERAWDERVDALFVPRSGSGAWVWLQGLSQESVWHRGARRFVQRAKEVPSAWLGEEDACLVAVPGWLDSRGTSRHGGGEVWGEYRVIASIEGEVGEEEARLLLSLIEDHEDERGTRWGRAGLLAKLAEDTRRLGLAARTGLGDVSS